ncbi:Oxalate decarboxylase OxdC [Colletotrichum orbiculare MAFF 240422]|uniref:Oxalate decarboxylase OxdC n=1 Tax=Colletotrichum orbiculare (strain 104-T / ATCC 96160 / CBS 514.97 / LARS 414 / MAFF 240422) TaxID=1213857 RepID=N4VNS1_COLOR|nr:Oxalate decarboxylase OxdC [Colletotrichum orbiculare MAFF 240422]
MHLPTIADTQLACRILLYGAVLGLATPSLAIPVQDSPRQRLLDGLQLPSRYRTNPYTPGYKDRYDGPVDSVGDKLDPLPYRNGLGASVLGPWNDSRSRQNPDLVRPPSTDHGNLANMRWSFADSHIRIEEGGWTR